MNIKDRVLAVVETITSIYGDDTLGMAEDVFAALEEEFGIKIPDEDSDNLVTIEEMAAYIRERVPETDTDVEPELSLEEMRLEAEARDTLTKAILPALRDFLVHMPAGEDGPIPVAAHSVEYNERNMLIFYERRISWTGDMPVMQTFMRASFRLWKWVEEVQAPQVVN